MRAFIQCLSAWLCVALIAVLSQTVCAQAVVCPLPANGMLYCPSDKKIYATTDSHNPHQLANTLSRVDPSTGKIEATIPVGENPSGLTQTVDGRYLYMLVGDDCSTICQVDRSSFKLVRSFPVGQGLAAKMLSPVPGLSKAVLVDRYNLSLTLPVGENLCVYMDGKPDMEGLPCGDQLAVGVDPSRIITNSPSGSSFFCFEATGSGQTDSGVSFMTVHSPITARGYGLVVTRGGDVVDPEARQVVGHFAGGGAELCIDPIRPIAYQVFDDRHPSIRAYDLRTCKTLWEKPLPAGEGSHHPTNPLRWGLNDFAFIDRGRILCTKLALGPAAPLVDLSVTRSSFNVTEQPKIYLYSLTVANRSGVNSTAAFLTETLPTSAQIITVTPSQGTATQVGQVLCVRLGSLAAHGSVSVKVKVHIADLRGDGLAAVVRSFDPDPDTSNNVYAGIYPDVKTAMTPTESPLNATWVDLMAQVFDSDIETDLHAMLIGHVVVTNKGNSASAPCVVEFYVQGDPAFAAPLAVRFKEVSVPSIKPGGQFLVSLIAQLPLNVDPRGAYAFATVDLLQANGPPRTISFHIAE